MRFEGPDELSVITGEKPLSGVPWPKLAKPMIFSGSGRREDARTSQSAY